MDDVENIGTPPVIEMLGRRWIVDSQLAIDWRVQTLFYENGFIVDLTVPVHVALGQSRFFAEAVPGFNYGREFDLDITASAPKFGLAAGLNF
jgi:hypothetical protein